MKIEKITSIKDEKIIFARNLTKKSERINSRFFQIVGHLAIEWVLKSACSLEFILIHDKLEITSFEKLLKQTGAPIYQCSDGILKKVTGTNYLIPLVAIAKMPPETSGLFQDLVIGFDGVQDFGNIGTIVRTASGFGIHEFFATSNDFDLFQRKTVDASRGSVFTSKCINFDDPKSAIVHLKKAGFQIVATALEGSVIQSLAKLKKKPTAIIFGNESSGVSKETLKNADLLVQIPMATSMDSLNVGVAAGISLYEIKLKVILMMLNEKIKGSLGRNLSCTSRWLRTVLNHKLREATDLNGDQAIILMILACDEKSSKSALIKASGTFSDNSEELFLPLQREGYIQNENNDIVHITEKGKDFLGKIWNTLEYVENIALEGFSEEDRTKLSNFLQTIQGNLNKIIPYE